MSGATAELIERVRGLVPLLAEHAAEAERIRRPVDSVIEALRDARVFDLMVPATYGGLGLDLDTFVEVGLALAEGDASTAWVTTFYIEHNWMLCHFPEAFQKQLYANRSHVLAPALLVPSGSAEPVDGGFRVSGRWHWGTGVMHAEWVIVAAPLARADGSSEFRFFTLPRDAVEIEDVWRVDGMSGTGSNDIRIDAAFVPAERSLPIALLGAGDGPGARLHGTPLYRTPMIPILVLAASMPAVGQANAALARCRQEMRERIRFGSTSKQAEKPALQIRLAQAEVEARLAEHLLREIASEVMSLRAAATPGDRARWAASGAYAVHQSRRVLESLADASGGSAHFEQHPLQRAVRDVRALSSHVIFDLDDRLETHGRAMLGFEPSGLI